jgi:Domain of unknown function (DUF5679)
MLKKDANRSPGRRRGKERTQMADRYEAYCVKCKQKREFDGEVVTMKNGRKAARGKCPVCGTTLNRILGNK